MATSSFQSFCVRQYTAVFSPACVKDMNCRTLSLCEDFSLCCVSTGQGQSGTGAIREGSTDSSTHTQNETQTKTHSDTHTSTGIQAAVDGTKETGRHRETLRHIFAEVRLVCDEHRVKAGQACRVLSWKGVAVDSQSTCCTRVGPFR